MIRQSSSRIELELQGVRTAIEDLEATSLEQRVLLDRTISQAANQGAILDALYDKLQRFPGLTTSLVDGRSITAPPSTPFLPFPYGNAVPEQDPYWSTSVALRLAQPHPGSCKCSCHRQKRILTEVTNVYVIAHSYGKPLLEDLIHCTELLVIYVQNAGNCAGSSTAYIGNSRHTL